MKIKKPQGDAISIHEAQGQLCLHAADIYSMSRLSIWILEDYISNKWTLKRTVTTLEIFGQNNIEFGYCWCFLAKAEESTSARIHHCSTSPGGI
jgi:hypothetical protein